MTLITRFFIHVFVLDNSGPVDEFILNAAGKTYMFEDNVNDCETKGGNVMVVNYEEASFNHLKFFK